MASIIRIFRKGSIMVLSFYIGSLNVNDGTRYSAFLQKILKKNVQSSVCDPKTKITQVLPKNSDQSNFTQDLRTKHIWVAS